MKRTSPRRWWLSVLLVGLLLVAVACDGEARDGSEGSDGSAAATKQTAKLAAAALNGSGATFPQAYYEAAISEFQSIQPAVTLSYAGTGSRRGQSDLQAGLVDWAGSDSIVTADEASSYPAPFLYFPTVAAPITISFRLAGVDQLQLSADTLAGIFQGEITTWNDQAIAADNPSADLPDALISVVHRSDGSGTTANFTQYLTRAAPSRWTLGTGMAVAWPVGQLGGSGSAAVARIVKRTEGAIGYVDLSDARTSDLVYAAIKNSSGRYVRPSVRAAAAALTGATLNPDLTYDPLNAAGANVYPITAPTYILVYQTQADPAWAEALKGFLDYIYGPGQGLAAEVSFVRLPASIRRQAQAQVEQISG